jgi:hypothetical protein
MWIGVAAILTAAAVGGQGWAQPSPAAKTSAVKESAAKAKETTPAKGAPVKPAGGAPAAPSQYRQWVPGVMRGIQTQRKGEEIGSRHDVTELVAIKSDFDWAKAVPFRQDVWVLDLKFKPIRMMWVDIPDPATGRMQQKLVWYLVYSVTNPGKALHPVEGADHTYRVETVDKPVPFIPNFTLEIHGSLQKDDAAFTKVYQDRLLPVALRAIREREDPARPFLSTAEMAAYPDITWPISAPPQPVKEGAAATSETADTPSKPKGIPVGKTVWGIVTWVQWTPGHPVVATEIDPRYVWFSIYIEGLTNAYRFQDDPAEYKARGQYRTIYHKALKLNFWRPGDEFTNNEDQIRWGVLHHDHSKILDKPDYEWVWRRTFPR